MTDHALSVDVLLAAADCVANITKANGFLSDLGATVVVGNNLQTEPTGVVTFISQKSCDLVEQTKRLLIMTMGVRIESAVPAGLEDAYLIAGDAQQDLLLGAPASAILLPSGASGLQRVSSSILNRPEGSPYVIAFADYTCTLTLQIPRS